VTFEESNDARGRNRLTLVYTIALPAPLAEPDLPGAEQWIPLLNGCRTQTEARERGRHLLKATGPAKSAVEYWREELEEETRLFEFLPRYFTARQARDVYSAFWGYEQDPDGFATWAGIGPNKEGVLSEYIEEVPLDDGALLPELVKAVREADPSSTMTELEAVLLCQKASTRAVGLWPRTDIDAEAPQALPSLAVAASLVAYQRPARGPKPAWYMRKRDGFDAERLERLYAPRAVWVFEPLQNSRSVDPDPTSTPPRGRRRTPVTPAGRRTTSTISDAPVR
jgi:hypothetical protein